MLSSIQKTASRPRNPLYPRELQTLGDHIRNKRLDLALEQKDVSKILHVTESTICNWEMNRNEPAVQHYPRIMDFLGYCPYQQSRSWGERLRLHRIHRGLSYEKLAKILDVDPGSIQRWETNRNSPCKYLQDKVTTFFNI